MTFRIPLLILALAASSFAEPIPVRHTQGAVHGFLVIHSESGANLGYGEFTQLAAGERVTTRFTLHFRDGSLDDETTIFTQRTNFQLVSDHHIQRGPFFKTATDVLVEANGQVTIRSTDKDGKEKVETNHMELPADISNGMVGTLLANVAPNASNIVLGMVVPSGKGRLVKLDISSDGTAPFTAVTGVRRTANLFRIKIDIGGVAGVVAPLVGKKPGDTIIWVLEGEVPLFVREVGQLSEGGPIVSIELAGTSFPHAANPKSP